jgi:enoyl-[acyl-carrier-protein] reductase (NADH)
MLAAAEPLMELVVAARSAAACLGKRAVPHYNVMGVIEATSERCPA